MVPTLEATQIYIKKQNKKTAIFVINYQGMDYHEHQLSNGIHLIHRQIPNLIAHVGLLMNTGSRDEAANEHGLAHLIEHLVFKGTETRTAREIAENLHRPEVVDARVLTALLEIVERPALDEPIETWSPKTMGRGWEDRRSQLRWWAAYLAGHIAGRLQDQRAVEVLARAADEEDPGDPEAAGGLRFFAAIGLGMLCDPAGAEVLARRLGGDSDPVVRAACAKSLGAIGSRLYAGDPKAAGLEAMREALLTAYRGDSDTDVTWNTAIALARIRDASGRATLQELAKHKDPTVRKNASAALEMLNGE